MQQSPYFTTLPNRGLIKVSGPDRRAFLQGLISNDVNLLDMQPCVYACLLNAQGKFLHDFFMMEKDKTILLDCEGGARAEDLARRLSMYKLRADVKIECDANIAVYSILSSSGLTGGSQAVSSTTRSPVFAEDGKKWKDPRHPEIGFRSFEKPDDIEEKPFEFYDRQRIFLTIPEGSRDMAIEKSTLLESNIDKLNGISFEKGCYIGQELTARMHYRNLGKKHLRTVKLDALPEGAELRSSCGDVGLALLKNERTH